MSAEELSSFSYKDLCSRVWRPALVGGLLFLIISLTANHFAFVYADAYSVRPTSTYVGDLVLDNLPVVDLNVIIVDGMLLAILVGTIFVLAQPRYIPFSLKTLALFIATRAFFISLTHVGIYPDHINPGLGVFNSIYLYFNFQTGLFFSGHTCMPIIMALIFWDRPVIRLICLAIALIFGVSVLLAHVHYSIDVFVAPFMAYGIFAFARYIFSHEYRLIRPVIPEHVQSANVS